jgi:hypothetical protein
MGFLDTLLGRTKPVKPNLDQLFSLPTAAVTLDVGADFKPTGVGSVCFKRTEGAAFAQVEADVEELLNADDGPRVEVSQDSYGFTWLLLRHSPDDIAGLVNDVHAVNSTLEANGFGPSLLCSLVSFEDARDRRVALVYLYKRGTFYPFAPSSRSTIAANQSRDNTLELQIKAQLGSDLPIEADLSRWFPVWGAPGL